jgi:tetratricopeptide (TPR) repeat protein
MISSLMELIDSSTHSFRDRLIEIIDDEKGRRNLNELKQDDQFIDTLVENYIDEISKSFETQDVLKIKYKKLKDIGDTAKSSDDYIDYTYVLFLTNSFSNPYTQKWAQEWLSKKQEYCRHCTLITFLYARMRLSSSHTAANEDVENERALNDLKKVLKTDPKSVIDAMYRLDKITLYIFAKHKNILDWSYNNNHKRLFPEVSKQLYPRALSSFYHTLCAEYYKIIGMEEEQAEESRRARDLYNKNSLAIVQLAYIKADEEPRLAEKMFEEALQLVKDQFSGLSTTQISIQAMAYAGLGYLYTKSALYSKAERCYHEALLRVTSSHSVSLFLRSLKSLILLNRGSSRLDDGRLKMAKEDFHEAAKDPDLLAIVENNLGILYHMQSFNKKAKSKFNHAIELNADLAEAYYNLGVVYNEEGRKDKANRLFAIALEIDGNLSRARDALEEFEKWRGGDIRDWYEWWFGSGTTRYKKSLGAVFLALILAGITWTVIDIHMAPSLVSGYIFGVLGFALIFLILPLVTKLKLGTIEVEIESKRGQPVVVPLKYASKRSFLAGDFALLDAPTLGVLHT